MIFSRTRWIGAIRRSTVLLAVLAFSACSADSLTGAGGDHPSTNTPVGKYWLKDINQAELPVEVHHGPWFDATNHHFYNQFILTVIDGAIELKADGTFGYWLDLSTQGDGAAPQLTVVELEGTYTIQGSVLSVIVNGEPTATLTIQNGQISTVQDLLDEESPKTFHFKK